MYSRCCCILPTWPNAWRTSARSISTGRSFLRLVTALTGLIVARELDSDYVWNASLSIARGATIDPKLIEAVEKGTGLAAVSQEHEALSDFCYQLLRGNHHVTDATYQAFIKQFGVPAAVQIAAILGYYVMMGLAANAFDVAPDGDHTKPAL